MIIDKYNEIAGKFLQNAYSNHKDENVVVSPYSFLMMLGLTLNAVSGESRKEIKEIFSKEGSVNEITDSLLNLYSNITDEEYDVIKLVSEEDDEDYYEERIGVKIDSSNAVCIKENLFDKTLPEFKTLLQETFNGELFATGDNAAKAINDWVYEKTDGMITEVVETIPDDFKLCIMNAVSFLANWADPYEDYQIIEHGKMFKNIDGTKSEAVMLKSYEEGYLEDDYVRGFCKSYCDYRYELVCLLPKKKSRKALSDLLEDINFGKYREQFSWSTRVIATMPEFKTESDLDLNDFCGRLGINKLFTPEAEFGGMFGEKHEPLMVNSINQKVCLKVDRKGTEAAALTSVSVCAGCAPEKIEVKKITLDRPFVYAVMDMHKNIPLFAGVVNKI